MKSSANNIDCPMKRVEINIRSIYDAMLERKYKIVSQDLYDLMQMHDPMTFYIILDSNDNRTYLGDQLIPSDKFGSKYLLAVEERSEGVFEYVIYLNLVSKYATGYNSRLLPVCRFGDPQKAINTLHSFKKVGSHSRDSMVTYLALVSYIIKDTGINETIIGIIANRGFRDDPRLQNLNELALSCNVSNGERDIPSEYISALHNSSVKDHMSYLYMEIYNVFVKFNFFKDSKYTDVDPESLNISAAVSEIDECFAADYVY